MRKLPIFDSAEIEFIENAVCESKKELIREGNLPCLSFTPFKNELMNKVVKYGHILKEQEYMKKDKSRIVKK